MASARQAEESLTVASDDRQVYEQTSILTPKPQFWQPKPQNWWESLLTIILQPWHHFLTLIHGITYTFNNLIEFKPNYYNIKNSTTTTTTW